MPENLEWQEIDTPSGETHLVCPACRKDWDVHLVSAQARVQKAIARIHFDPRTLPYLALPRVEVNYEEGILEIPIPPNDFRNWEALDMRVTTDDCKLAAEVGKTS